MSLLVSSQKIFGVFRRFDTFYSAFTALQNMKSFTTYIQWVLRYILKWNNSKWQKQWNIIYPSEHIVNYGKSGFNCTVRFRPQIRDETSMRVTVFIFSVLYSFCFPTTIALEYCSLLKWKCKSLFISEYLNVIFFTAKSFAWVELLVVNGLVSF